MDTGEESFEDDNLGIQAFHVESDEDDLDLDIPPTTGNEYLRRVRMEASGCPKIVVADLDVKSLNKKQTVHVKEWIGDHQPAPRGFAPSLQWQNMQVANFAEQRQNLARYKAKRKTLKVTKLPTVPHANDVEAWCRLCFGRLRPPARLGQDPSKIKSDLNTSENETDIKMDSDRETTDADRPESSTTFPSHEGILPLVSVMVAMDQPTVLKVLEYHLNWFEATGFTERQGYWFYALLVSLDKPLIPDACSLLRGLARACSRLRASLESIDDPRLTPLNLFICLISRYFDQSDLMDRVT
ncbi:gem-associated protein 2-like [Ruditapes philippinarum]|uniref:gem-associated protein 2-like n=1 Tax=Ruditapes philippinarum TaxID=129788 RepID=UPI00295B1F6E|nr:gem-associated protein 2-like [Ruditapes philippinarum]XP_060561602.1 gem-associated protein 2-like [Ruditapes philippinarum]